MGGDRFSEFVGAIRHHARADQVKTAWVRVKEVDWENRSMTAIGETDNLEYYNVLLGIGAMDIRPAEGSLALIGGIEGQMTTSYLIAAERIDEIYLNVSDATFNIQNEGYIIKHNGEDLKDILNDLISTIMQLTVTTNQGPSGVPINNQSFQSIKTRVSKLMA